MSHPKASILTHDVFPFLGALAALAVAALAMDAVLHVADLVWIGRYLGILGTLMILWSLRYSLRKRKWIKSGSPVRLMRQHEYLAWAGSLLILVHAGIHFNAVLAWLATLAMVINIISGLTGKFLLKRARIRIEATRQHLRELGTAAEDIEEFTHWDSLTYDAVKAWRTIHVPITLAFGVSALAHIIAIFLFWGWE
jgi:hypothetical protein